MAIQLAIIPNTFPLTISGQYETFKEAATEIRAFLVSQKNEISIPIADTTYPLLHIQLGIGMVDIRVIPNKGIFVTGEQQYLDILVATFNFFDPNDKELNTAVLGPKVQNNYFQNSSNTIALEAT